MTEDRQTAAQQTASDCYLSMLLATANALAVACPEVGGIYRHRLTRLRARLAFDSSTNALEASRNAVESELKEYATEAAEFSAHHTGELRSTISALEEMVRNLVSRQDFYAARLRQFARQMETANYPASPDEVQEVVALQAAGLLSCVESMSHETQSLTTRVRDELVAMEQRIKDAALTDPLTGLMNRREMERRIEAFKSKGGSPVLLHFRLTSALPGPFSNDVTQQVAARLASQFRHNDFISRWSENEFMVLFQGPIEIARARSEQIVPWIAGRYVVDGRESAEVGVEVALLEPELAQAAV